MQVCQMVARVEYPFDAFNIFENGQWRTIFLSTGSPIRSSPQNISGWHSVSIESKDWTHRVVDNFVLLGKVGSPNKLDYGIGKGFEFKVAYRFSNSTFFHGVNHWYIDAEEQGIIPRDTRIYWMEFDPDLSTLDPNNILLLGTAAPPPPPPKDMPCCDCNVIATIIAENAIAELKQHEATREHIDRRTIEGLREINKMLQGMNFSLNLQPIIDRLNELEANLWNGLKAGG